MKNKHNKKDVEQFIGTLPHELKSSLTTFNAFLSFMKEDLESESIEKVRESIVHLEKAALRMNQLANEFSELNRLGYIKIEMDKK